MLSTADVKSLAMTRDTRIKTLRPKCYTLRHAILYGDIYQDAKCTAGFSCARHWCNGGRLEERCGGSMYHKQLKTDLKATTDDSKQILNKKRSTSIIEDPIPLRGHHGREQSNTHHAG